MTNANLTSHCGASVFGELPVSLRSAPSAAVPKTEANSPFLPSATLFTRESATKENLSLVRFLARQLHARLPQHVELDDLVSAGTVGLLDAVKRFDGEKKTQFRSYAQYRIRGAMMDSLRAADWSPRTLRRQARLVEQAKQTLAAQGLQAPDDQQTADQMGVPLATYRQLVSDLKRLELGSLQTERHEDAVEQVIDSVPAPASEDPLFLCLQGETWESLKTAIEALPEKERLVLNLYYYEELTMKEISEVLGVVGSRVSQLHASAVQRLRTSFCAGTQQARRKA